MSEKKPSAAEFALAQRDAENYFELQKNRGKILVNEGKISKEQYYEQIRKVGIETNVISPDQFQGGAPAVLEPILEIGLGTLGYIVGSGIGLTRGAPQLVGSAGFGVGSGIGQATFDAINKLTADEGQVVKPNNVILNDALKQAGIDASLSYGIDKTLLFGGKGVRLAKNVTVQQGKKAIDGLKSLRDKLTPEQQRKYIEKFSKGKTGQTEIGKKIASEKVRTQKIIDNRRKNQEAEGMTATRYQVLAGSGTIGEAKRGFSDATQIVPMASFYGAKSFQNTLDDALSSIQNPLVKGSGKNINDRAAFTNGDAFIKDIRGDYVRNPERIKSMEKAYDSLPMVTYANLIKISDDNFARYNKEYKDFEKLTKETDIRFDTTNIQKGILELNETLKKTLVEENMKYSSALPKFMKNLISTRTTPSRVTGTQVIPGKQEKPPTDLSGKQMLELYNETKNFNYDNKIYDLKGAALTRDLKSNRKAVESLRKQIVDEIESKDEIMSGTIKRANDIFKQNEQFLTDNELLLSLGKTLEGKSYNPLVYDGFRDEYRRLTGDTFKTIAGRGNLKNVSPQTVVSDFLQTTDGIAKLGIIMRDSAKLKLAERRKQAAKDGTIFIEESIPIRIMKPVLDENGAVTSMKPTTVNVSEVQKAEQEFGDLLLNQIEDVFDNTLLKTVRDDGRFDPDGFLNAIGYFPPNATKRAYYKELINQAKKTKDNSMSEIAKRDKNTKGVFLENVDYNRIVNFAEMFRGFQDKPGVSKFLLRRAPLALSSSVTVAKALPLAGAGLGAGIMGLPGFITTVGILNLFNKYISSPVGMSYWKSVRGDSSKLGEFLSAIYNDAFGQAAIRTSIDVGNIIRGLPRALLVSAGQDIPSDLTGGIVPEPVRTREQYYDTRID